LDWLLYQLALAGYFLFDLLTGWNLRSFPLLVLAAHLDQLPSRLPSQMYKPVEATNRTGCPQIDVNPNSKQPKKITARGYQHHRL